MVRNKLPSDAVSSSRKTSIKFEMFSEVTFEANIYVCLSVSQGTSKIVSLSAQPRT